MKKQTIIAIVLIVTLALFILRMHQVTLRDEINKDQKELEQKSGTKVECQKDSKGNDICVEIGI